jgi:hypothetical protein
MPIHPSIPSLCRVARRLQFFYLQNLHEFAPISSVFDAPWLMDGERDRPLLKMIVEIMMMN